MERPSWAEPLEPKGVYYEGTVDNASILVERMTAETVTTSGTRRSRHLQPVPRGKENSEQVSVNSFDLYTHTHGM